MHGSLAWSEGADLHKAIMQGSGKQSKRGKPLESIEKGATKGLTPLDSPRQHILRRAVKAGTPWMTTICRIPRSKPISRSSSVWKMQMYTKYAKIYTILHWHKAAQTNIMEPNEKYRYLISRPLLNHPTYIMELLHNMYKCLEWPKMWQ